MVKNKFNILFSVAVFHSYFKQGTYNSLLFTPTPSTKKIMNRFGFIIQKQSNGFEFYTTSSKSFSTFIEYVQKVSSQSTFEFNIDNTDTNFNIFTELAINWIGQLNYSTERTTSTGKTIELNTIFEEKATPSNFGKLTIYFKDLVDLLEKNKNIFYNINYKARKTQWQYYIINTSNLPTENLIVKNKAEVYFTGPTTTKIQTGQEAFLFSSKETLAMCEQPFHKFDLIHSPLSATKTINYDSTTKTIFKGLPNPDPGRIGTIEENGELLVTSPMYVYI